MAAVKLLDFQDIYEAVMEQLKIPTTDTTTLARVKRDINMVYVNEVAPSNRWPWLRKRIDINHAKYYNTGTANVSEDSATVVISSAIAASKLDYFFAVEGDSVIYKISSHTAASDTLTLSIPFNGSTTSTASYKIWTNEVALPTDCRETVDVRHDFSSRPMVPRGTQKIDEIASMDWKSEARPKYYSTDDFYDPTPGTVETEADRYRICRVYPAVYDKNTSLHVTYIQEVAALDLAADEPAMPVEDRMVLVYGALKQSWIRERNETTADINSKLFNTKLALMKGRYEDSSDHPRIEVDDIYTAAKRSSNRGSWR